MDIQFVEPLLNTQSDKTFRLAKLNNTTKRPVLENRYNAELAKMKQIVNQVTEHKPIQEVREQRIELAINNSEFSEFMFPQNVNNTGARKLKVNNMVKEKTTKCYNTYLVNNVKKEEPVVASPTINVNQAVEAPHVVTEPPVINVPKENVEPMETSRMSRLYRTGEMPTLEVNNDVQKGSDVINTPSRFEKQENNPLYEAAHALINDEVNNVQTQASPKIKVGEEAQRLNHINEVNKPNNFEASDKFEEAMMKYKESDKARKAAQAEAMRTQEEYERVLKEYKEFQERRIAQVNDATRENLEAEKEYTIHSADLTRQIQEMMAQMNEERGMKR